MPEHDNHDELIYKTEGPIYKDGLWVSSITLKKRVSQDFQGETKEDVQEKMLQYLGQQALEIEKARVLLRKMFEGQSQNFDII